MGSVYTKINKKNSTNPMALWWGNTDGLLSLVVGRKADVGTGKMWAFAESTGAGRRELGRKLAGVLIR